MITELAVEPMPIAGGRKIKVNEYNIRQFRLHHVLTQISRLMLSNLEGTSNDTAARVSGHDVSDFVAQWAICKDRLVFAFENRESFGGSHDIARKILLPTYNELAGVRNVKLQAVLDEIMNACQVILSVDSAGFQMDLDKVDYDKIQASFDVVDKVIAYWLGSPGDEERGVFAPAYERTGILAPDVDMNAADVLEPSADMRKAKLPDSPDHD
jgi:hypothetical protein